MVSFPKISPNLLLVVGGVIAAVFLVSQIRKAGADVQDALSGIQLPSIGDIKFPDIKFPDVTFPDITFPTIDIKTGIDKTVKDLQDSIESFVKGFDVTDPFKRDVIPEFEDKTPSEGLLGQEEILDCKCGTSIVQDAQGIVTQKCIVCPEEIIPQDEPFIKTAAEIAEEEAFKRSVIQVTPEIIPTVPTITSDIQVLLPDEQIFVGGGPSFIGATIRENPIDTLQEAIALGLTASQAADFLAATGGVITPSQIEQGIIDPDIRNIVAGFIGEGEVQAFPVSSTPLETLSIKESEAQRSAEFTCKTFGLNCELVDSMMA